MHTELDKIDIAIINSLMKDGRKSFRQIAKEIRMSTPTVEAHFSRMKGLGIIKNVQPIFNIDRIENEMTLGIISLKTDPLESINIANRVSLIREVKGVYLISGNYNVVLKVAIAKSHQNVEEFVREKIAVIKGIRSASYQIVTRTVKDEHTFPIEEGTYLKIKCDYCENEIMQSAKILEIGHQFKRYFCCNSCLTLYKQKYKGRIETASISK